MAPAARSGRAAPRQPAAAARPAAKHLTHGQILALSGGESC